MEECYSSFPPVLRSFGIFWVLERGFSFLGFVSRSSEGGNAAAVFCFGVRPEVVLFPVSGDGGGSVCFLRVCFGARQGVSVSGDGGGFVLLPGRAFWFCFLFLFGVRICFAKLLDALDFGIWCWILGKPTLQLDLGVGLCRGSALFGDARAVGVVDAV
ncbi:hypothetical protein QL285_086562 [Trifolium repens]|nr:hypothetical protein QL285_086562 [Trifolium repens]